MAENSKIEWHALTAAKRIGVDPEEYFARLALGEKWCTRCKAWHSRAIFPKDKSRGDGLACSCRGYQPSKLPASREARREKANAYARLHYANGGKVSINARKLARRRKCEPVIRRHRELVFESFDGRCAYCSGVATTIDHLVPVSQGGHSGRGNIVPACLPCNSRKRTKPWDDFLLTAPNPLTALIIDELMMEVIL